MFLPEPGSINSKAYVGTNGTVAVWAKPPGCTMVHIFCIGGGGGGGGGDTDSLSSSFFCGGEGGGSGAYAVAVYLAQMLPNYLYVTTPIGGAAGAPLASGGAGGSAVVKADSWAVSQNYLIAAGGGGGGLFDGNAGGLAGAANAGLTISMSNWAVLYAAVAGNAGGRGATNTLAAASVTLGTGLPILGGAGGGSIPFLPSYGGGITAISNSPFGGYAGPVNRLDAIRCRGFGFGQYPVVYGGVGGAGATASGPALAGGGSRGGGAWGSGGGGGGAKNGGGAAGGDGGPGLVVISWW